MGKAGQPVKVAIGDRGHKKFSPTIVRAPPFYQNFYGCLNGIQAGTLYYPLEDKELTHVDFVDVGKVSGSFSVVLRVRVCVRVRVPCALSELLHRRMFKPFFLIVS